MLRSPQLSLNFRSPMSNSRIARITATRAAPTAGQTKPDDTRAIVQHFTPFGSPDLLLQVLTQSRWNIIRIMPGNGPLSLHEIAQRLDRDPASVQLDVHALLDVGVLDRTPTAQLSFRATPCTSISCSSPREHQPGLSCINVRIGQTGRLLSFIASPAPHRAFLHLRQTMADTPRTFTRKGFS